MNIEFRKAQIPAEIKELVRFDRKIFKADAFPEFAWRSYEVWWMMLEGRKIGCCAFEMNVDFPKNPDRECNPRRKGSLYIATTGILPAFRALGFGKVMKSWQIAYARCGKFKRIVTNSRKSNEAMISLNRQFGFRRIRTVANYYHDPVEATVVMELVLRR